MAVDFLTGLMGGLIERNDRGNVRLSPTDLIHVARADSLVKERDRLYQLYANYYGGQHEDPRTIDFGDRTPSAASTSGFAHAHNFLSVVVDVLVERLALRGLGVTGDGLGPEAAADLAARLWAWWQANRMDEAAITIHAQTLVKGDAFVLVDYDPARQMPRFTYNDALEIDPVYDDRTHRMTAVYKTWSETYEDAQGFPRTRYRLTKYTDAEILKLYRDGGDWRLWEGDLDSAGRPDGGRVAWVDRAGSPLGIPVIHFRNKPRGDDFGRSEIGDSIPLQDEINRRIWATSEAISYQGAPQRYIIDAKPPRAVQSTDDEFGGFVSGPGHVWAIASATPELRASVGQFEFGNVAALEDAVDRQIKRLAAQTRTPAHLLWPDGPLPSGESLKTAEAGLIAKCMDRSISFGNGWEDVFQLAIRLHNTFGPGDPIREDLTISAEWAPFETRSEEVQARVVQAIGDNLSQAEKLRRMGYTQEEIDQILEEQAGQDVTLNADQ